MPGAPLQVGCAEIVPHRVVCKGLACSLAVAGPLGAALFWRDARDRAWTATALRVITKAGAGFFWPTLISRNTRRFRCRGRAYTIVATQVIALRAPRALVIMVDVYLDSSFVIGGRQGED